MILLILALTTSAFAWKGGLTAPDTSQRRDPDINQIARELFADNPGFIDLSTLSDEAAINMDWTVYRWGDFDDDARRYCGELDSEADLALPTATLSWAHRVAARQLEEVAAVPVDLMEMDALMRQAIDLNIDGEEAEALSLKFEGARELFAQMARRSVDTSVDLDDESVHLMALDDLMGDPGKLPELREHCYASYGDAKATLIDASATSIAHVHLLRASMARNGYYNPHRHTLDEEFLDTLQSLPVLKPLGTP